MWTQAEIIAISIGIAAAAFTSMELALWNKIPRAVHEFFYGGRPGAFLVGTG